MTTVNRIRRLEIMIGEKRFETNIEKLGTYIFKSVIKGSASKSTKKLVYNVLNATFLNSDFVDGIFYVILDLLDEKVKSDFEFFFTTLKAENRTLNHKISDSEYLERFEASDEIDNSRIYETPGLDKIRRMATKSMITKYIVRRQSEINRDRFYTKAS